MKTTHALLQQFHSEICRETINPNQNENPSLWGKRRVTSPLHCQRKLRSLHLLHYILTTHVVTEQQHPHIP